MHSTESMVMETTCSPQKHTSYCPIQRSVPGMKNLLPLRLLSPPLPELSSWPSLGPNNRSTFGREICPNATNNPDVFQDEDHHDMPFGTQPARQKRYRDVPIYTEPGSPVFNSALYTDDDAHSSSQTASDETFYPTEEPDTGEHTSEDDMGIDPGHQDEASSISEADSAVTDRSSALSFQCSGEPLFSNEAALLRSPSKHRRLKSRSMTSLPTPPFSSERKVESWLSDASSCGDDQDDIFARATALAPAKAHVVEVNGNRALGLSITVPPRSSSLAGTIIIPTGAYEGRNSWIESSYSPSATPSGPWTDICKEPSNHLTMQRQLNSHFPAGCLDLAMTSPPASPTGSRSNDANSLSSHSSRTPKNNSMQRRSKMGNSAEKNASHPEPPPEFANDILTMLEELTSTFPSTMLTPDSPCIVDIRNHLSSRSAPSSRPSELRSFRNIVSSPFDGNQSLPRNSIAQRRKTTNFSKYRRLPSATTSRSYPVPRSVQVGTLQDLPYSSNFHSEVQTWLPPPDLQSLHSIFPRGSKYMRSSLYANVLAHIFVTSLSTSPPTKRSQKKRRDTPYWPTTEIPWKAANILGIHSGDGGYGFDASNENTEWNTRISQLAETLKKSIACLISAMDPDSCHEDFVEMEVGTAAPGVGSLLIRSLEEVVLRCETSSSGSF